MKERAGRGKTASSGRLRRIATSDESVGGVLWRFEGGRARNKLTEEKKSPIQREIPCEEMGEGRRTSKIFEEDTA